jgi:hypothetical protein
VYIERPISDRGVPFDHFLICEPQLVDAEAMRLAPRGVTLVERGGVTHVIDWIGSAHYPNVADFIAEARHLGISRRVARTIDFGKLSCDSRLLLVHSRASIANASGLRAVLYREREDRKAEGFEPSGRIIRASCPQRRPQHVAHPGTHVIDPATGIMGSTGTYRGMCQALYWDDVEHGETVLDPSVPWRTVERTIGETTYRARRRPEPFEPEYQLAIFASFPIGRLAVIDDPGAPEGVAETLKRVREAQGLDVTLEEE